MNIYRLRLDNWSIGSVGCGIKYSKKTLMTVRK